MTESHRNVSDLAQRIATRLKQAERFHQLGLAMHEVRTDISKWYVRACGEMCLDTAVDWGEGSKIPNEEMHQRLVVAVLSLSAANTDPSLRDYLLDGESPSSDWVDKALQDNDAPEEIQAFYSGLLIGHLIAKQVNQ